MRFLTISLIVHAPDPVTEHRESLERFQSSIAPVLRREIPDPPWDWDARPGATGPVDVLHPALEGV